jgi:hypothetical protein
MKIAIALHEHSGSPKKYSSTSLFFYKSAVALHLIKREPPCTAIVPIADCRAAFFAYYQFGCVRTQSPDS